MKRKRFKSSALLMSLWLSLSAVPSSPVILYARVDAALPDEQSEQSSFDEMESSSTVNSEQVQRNEPVSEEFKEQTDAPQLPFVDESTTEGEDKIEDHSEDQNDSLSASESEKQNDKDLSMQPDSGQDGKDSSAQQGTDPESAEILSPLKEAAPVLYRLYNPNTGEHLYTSKKDEKTQLVRLGWKDEGEAWTPVKEGTQVHRLFNPNDSDHHYTSDPNEIAALVKAGWKDEGLSFYSDEPYGQPIYRLYNPNAKSGAHHYTPDANERDTLASKGWKSEGVSFYARSAYRFERDPQTGRIKVCDPQGKWLSGRVKIYDNTYDLGSDGLMITGWTSDSNGQRRWYDSYGREGFGLRKTGNTWSYFDEKSGIALVHALKTFPDGRQFYFDDQGCSVSGRIFIYPKCGQSDGNGKITWNDYGWKNDANRHSLLQAKASLDAKAQQIRKENRWDEHTDDQSVQDVMAQLARVDELLKAQEHVSVHSVYNPNSGEHLYTSKKDEIDNLVRHGWKDEGASFDLPLTSSAPIYRVYNPSQGDHHYTMDRNEVLSLTKAGWKDEGTVFYSAEVSTIPVYRLYNPNAKAGSHHFTIKVRERDGLESLGWKNENVAFQALGLYSFVREQTPSGTGLRAYDPQDRLVSGLADIQGYRYYADPARSDLLAADARTIPYNGREIRVRFDANGRMIFGEFAVNGKTIFYDLDSGEQLFNRFAQYGVPRKVCYFDENGYRAGGYKTIGSKKYLFDQNTGALKPDYADLKNQVTQMINASRRPGEQIAFALRVPGKEESIILNSRSQQSASVMKAFVMGAIHEDYERYAAFAGRGRLEQQLSVMISISDNEAWKYLVSVLGMGSYSAGLQVLRSWNQAHGYNETYMNGVPYGNFTSSHDASKILCDIQEGKLKHSAKMKALLQSQRHPGRLLQGIPAEARTGNKPGWVDGCENDTVLVDAPYGTYVITLLCDQMQSSARAKALMGQISPFVYGWMRENMNLGTSIPQI